MDFLPLGDIGIVLSNALQCEFLHQVYLVGLLEMLGLGHKRRFKTHTSMFLKESFPVFFFELLTMNFCTLMGKVAE